MSVGPRILGHATDLVFAGLFSRDIPAGTTQAEAVEALRQQGEDKLADMLAAMDHVVPGQGVDFAAVGDVLLLVLAVYAAASVLGWLQGMVLNRVVQNTVYRMRQDVEDKINRLPLNYFDRSPRGELLSRVTNDIDNISQTLQQTMSQLMTSLLTVVAVLGMMFWISPLLALVALVSVPLSLLVTRAIMKRSQGQFVAQWRRTGHLNAQIEEAYSGHALVKVFGRQAEVEKTFAEENDELYKVSFGAQFVSGLIMPAMMFLGNLNYVRDRGDRRPPGGVGVALARRGAGVHPVHPPVHPAAHHRGLDDEPAAVRSRVGRAGLRAPRRRRGAARRRRRRGGRRRPSRRGGLRARRRSPTTRPCP